MSSVALGVKVFKREKKLRKLLESLDPSFFDIVYVADDGRDSEYKTDLFNEEWPFKLVVYDLEYDAGLGYGRKVIVDKMEEDYLMIVDSDHEVVCSLKPLLDILEGNPDVGGVSTLMLENEYLVSGCHDIKEESLYNKHDVLVRYNSENKEAKRRSGRVFIPFDFLPNAALFRRECLSDYSWDEEYVIEYEHLDFYVGHYKETNWKFGICPEVIINHNPGGNTSYVKNRNSSTKENKSRDYFLNKWGYRDIVTKERGWPNNENEIRAGIIPNLFWKLPPKVQTLIKSRL